MGAADPWFVRWAWFWGSPVALGMLWLVAVGILTALFLRGQRPGRAVVSSAAPWLSLGPGDTRAPGRLFPRLRGRWARFWRWLLEVLVVTCLVLALGSTFRRFAGPPLLVLVDLSASMAAVGDDGQSRLEAGIAALRQRLGAGSLPSAVLIAGFAEGVRPATAFVSPSDPAVQAALAGLRPTGQAADLDAALAFARVQLRGHPRAQILLVTDHPEAGVLPGDSAGLPPVELLPDARPARGGGSNLAIAKLEAWRAEQDPELFQAAARVHNHGPQQATATVTLVAGGTAKSHELVLPPGGFVTLTLGGRDPRAVPVEARLAAADRVNALALDDRAFAALPAMPRPRVLVVGAKNGFLEAALLSLGPALRFEWVAPTALDEAALFSDPGRVVIFAGVAPPAVPEHGQFLFFAPNGPGAPVAQGAWVPNPIPSRVDRDHPILADVSLADLNIRRARRLSPLPDDQVVVASFATPLLVARSRPGLRLVQVAFPFDGSDLPLRPAWPLLLGNLLSWLGGETSVAPATAWPLGAVATASLADSGEGQPSAAVVEGPDGATTTLFAPGPSVQITLSEPGFYRIFRAGSAEEGHLLAATFAAPSESDLPSTSEGPSPGQAEVHGDPRAASHRDLDRPFWWLLLGLVLLLCDWLTRRPGGRP